MPHVFVDALHILFLPCTSMSHASLFRITLHKQTHAYRKRLRATTQLEHNNLLLSFSVLLTLMSLLSTVRNEHKVNSKECEVSLQWKIIKTFE